MSRQFGHGFFGPLRRRSVAAAPTGNAAISTLTDDFTDNSINTSLWTTGRFLSGVTNGNNTATVGGTVNETGGAMTVAPTASTATVAYNGYVSQNLYDLTGSGIYISVSSIASSPAGEQIYFAVGPDTDHTYGFYKDAANLVFFFRNGTTLTTVTGIVFSGTSHRWWKIRESGGTIFFDTGPHPPATNPPSSGEYTNQASVALSSSIIPDKTAVKVGFGAGTNVSVASPVTPLFNGINAAQ